MMIWLKALLFLGALGTLFLSSLTACAAQDKVTRTDCEVSFVVPKQLEYIEVQSPNLRERTACFIAFKRARPPESKPLAGQTEGWREQIDYAIEVKRMSIDDNLQDYYLTRSAQESYRLDESKKTSNAPKMKLVCIDSFDIANGAGIIAKIDAVSPVPSMTRRGVKGQIVFAVGNRSISASYALWPSTLDKRSQADVQAMTSLFESFEILER